jgi:hypothetical protein
MPCFADAWQELARNAAPDQTDCRVERMASGRVFEVEMHGLIIGRDSVIHSTNFLPTERKESATAFTSTGMATFCNSKAHADFHAMIFADPHKCTIPMHVRGAQTPRTIANYAWRW